MTLAQALTLNGILFAIVCAFGSYIWKNFKHAVEKRLDEINKTISDSAPAITAHRTSELEKNYEKIHLWKNGELKRQLEQINSNVYGVIDNLKADINRRFDRIEDRIFHGDKKR